MKKNLNNYLLILLGNTLLAFAVAVFIIPNNIVTGGVTGLGMIAGAITGIKAEDIIPFLNIGLLLLSFILLGKEFASKIVFSTLYFPLMIKIFSNINYFHNITDNIIIAIFYGAAIAGFGLGLVFRGQGATGGTDVITILLSRHLKLPIGRANLIVDSAIVVLGVFLVGLEAILFGILVTFIMGRTIDSVQIGPLKATTVFIISSIPDKIRDAVYAELDRGVTFIRTEGGYTHEARNMVMVTVANKEFTKLREVILTIDPKAFITATNATEISGLGFTIDKSSYRV